MKPPSGTRIDVPATEGIKYAGSKRQLLPYILQLAGKVKASRVLDGFAGTTRVSQAFAARGYQVMANDISAWSRVFATCYLLNRKSHTDHIDLIAYLNALPGRDGWFTEQYGGEAQGGSSIQKDGRKKPWQIHNTRRLDAIREEIERLGLGEPDKSVALTSLMLALDEVDNTLGHFASYLKEWSPRSYKDLCLKVPDVHVHSREHEVRQQDIFDLVGNASFDLAYLDPPYGSNNEKMPPSRVRYAAYYHLWTTICLFDRPELFGKAKRRADTSDAGAASVFEEFRRDESGRFLAVAAIERLLRATEATWIILSYSSGGRATAEELAAAIRNNGRLLEVVKVDHRKNVMAGMQWTNEWASQAAAPNQEFLFLMEKR